MKKLISIGILLGIISATNIAFAQNQMMNEMTITPPTYQNADFDNLNELLLASVDYPQSAYNDSRQGREVIRFAVSPSGTIEDITVVNSVSLEIDELVINALLSTQDKWNPGSIDGEPTTMVREISMIFVLNSYKDMLKLGQHYMQKGNKLMYLQNKPNKALQYFNKAHTLFPYEASVDIPRASCFDRLGLSEEPEIILLAENNAPGLIIRAK